MNARKVVAELILSDHPNDCLTCPKCGNCELQTLALRFNIREMPFNGGELSPRKREITASIVRNMDKCISVAAVKVSVTMFRQSVRSVPSVADSTRR